MENKRKKQINLIKKELKNEIKITSTKLKITNFGLSFISVSISVLNITIICLAIWAIIILSIRIENKDASILEIIMPLIVAIFTIMLFIISIFLSIYNKKSKTLFFQKSANQIQYLVLKIKNDPDFDLKEGIEIINTIKKEEVKNNNVDYKKVIKKILIGDK